MITISFARFSRSFRHAVHGLVHAFTAENSFRIHTVIAVVVAGLTIIFRPPPIQVALVVIVIASILILELVNTIVERLADLLEPRVHPYVHIIKDLMAAAVVVAATAALIVGIIVFWPYFQAFWS